MPHRSRRAQWEAWLDAPVAGDNPVQEAPRGGLGGILTRVQCPAPHRVSRTVLPCVAWGWLCSHSWQPAGHQRAGFGFSGGPCELPQSCLKGRLFCLKNFYSWSFSTEGPRVTELGLNLSTRKPLAIKSPSPCAAHVSFQNTSKSQREAELNSFNLCLWPWHSTWCQTLLLIGLFACQMEAGDSHPRCARLVWRPDYRVGVSSWPLIKGTLTHITFQLLALSSARRRSALKQHQSSKPTFVILCLRGSSVMKNRLPSLSGWR